MQVYADFQWTLMVLGLNIQKARMICGLESEVCGDQL